MPKKFGINPKSLEARQTKKLANKQKLEYELRIKEDNLWKDDNKELQAKEERKKLLEQKKIIETKRKEETQRLADLETEKLENLNNPGIEINKTKNKKKEKKIDKQHGDNNIEEEIRNSERKKLKYLDKDINPNHALREKLARLDEEGDSLMKGNNLTEDQKMFKHPEKKWKQAWERYKRKNGWVINKENPHLRGSQVIQILYNNFGKSSENPYNQNWVEYNTKLG